MKLIYAIMWQLDFELLYCRVVDCAVFEKPTQPLLQPFPSHSRASHYSLNPRDPLLRLCALPVCAGIPVPYFSKGCYNDLLGGWRMLPLLRSSSGVNGIGISSSCMTIGLCGYIAQAQGYAFFGVEAGTCTQGGWLTG